MTKSTEVLKKIDHGDITILLEYGERIFGALFIKGTESAEVRGRLKEFVKTFDEKLMEEKVEDWAKEGYDVADFFSLAKVLSKSYTPVLEEDLKNTSSHENQQQEEAQDTTNK